METALVEKSIYLPPIVVGFLFVYRTLFGGVLTEHPITKPYTLLASSIQIAADTMIRGMLELVNATHAKAMVLKQTYLMNAMNMVTVNIYRMMTVVTRNVNLLVSALANSLYSIVTTVTETLSLIRFHFKTVVHQTYNSTSNMFTALHKKTSGFEMMLTNVRAFFFPPQKNTLDYFYLGTLVTVAFLVLAVTVYYLSKGRTKTVEIPVAIEEPVKMQEETVTPVRKNPVRRKAKVN